MLRGRKGRINWGGIASLGSRWVGTGRLRVGGRRGLAPEIGARLRLDGGELNRLLIGATLSEEGYKREKRKISGSRWRGVRWRGGG